MSATFPNFLVFLLVSAGWVSVSGQSEKWAPFPIQRRSEVNPETQVDISPESYPSNQGGDNKGHPGEGDAGDSGGSEEDGQKPFIWTDIQVPASFLRIEYMIGYSFMGLMYGLGFLVFFQSLVVPTAKFLTAFVYIVFVSQGLMDPITLEDALQQLPPN